MIDRFGKRSLNTPTAAQPRLQGAIVYAQFVRPVFQALGLSVQRNKVSVASIASLLGTRGPFAVALGIAKVIVNSLNSMPRRWAWPHVSIEHFKRLPPLADSDATFTVVLVRRAILILASAVNTLPRSVFRRPFHAMRCVAGATRVTAMATTAFGLALGEIASPYLINRSALALTQPSRLPPLVEPSVVQDGQPPKHLPRQVFHAGRDRSRIRFSHDETSDFGLVRTVRQHQLSGRLHYNTLTP